jgi:hypothetical protein
MKDETPDRRRDLLGALPASLVLHGLIIALLVYGLPKSSQQQQQDQAINVALVPPPDQPRPKPVPAPPPKETKVERPPLPEKQPPKPASIEVLKPVFQFGDKDTGPRKSLDGGGARDRSTSPAKDDGQKPPAAQDTEKQTAAAPPMPAEPSGAGEVALPASVDAPKPRPVSVPKSGRGSATGSRSTDMAAATSQRYSGLPGVRRLYSQGATGDALATTSTAGVPRGKRAATLCASELQQQLQSASYFPDLVPMILLKDGNILDVPETAFHTGTTWYGLSFRCEVDTDATRVLSFAFHIGSAIPPDEWARLGLPIRY